MFYRFGCFLRSIGAEPLDRSKVDTWTVRKIVRHLRTGQVVWNLRNWRLDGFRAIH